MVGTLPTIGVGALLHAVSDASNTDANAAETLGEIKVESSDTLSSDTIQATKRIAMNGTVVMTTKDSYQRVACWQ